MNFIHLGGKNKYDDAGTACQRNHSMELTNVNEMWMKVDKANILNLQILKHRTFHKSTALVIVGDFINNMY